MDEETGGGLVKLSALIARLVALSVEHGDVEVWVNEGLSGEDSLFEAQYFPADEDSDERIVLW